MTDCTGKRVLSVGCGHASDLWMIQSPAERINAPTIDVAIEAFRNFGPFDLIVVSPSSDSDRLHESAAEMRKLAPHVPLIVLPISEPSHRPDSPPSGRAPDGYANPSDASGPCIRDSGGEPHRRGPAGPRVLVVDDDRFAVRLIERTLENAGYEVLTAGDGVEGLRVLQDEGAQIIVSDWMMPAMDGLDFCRAIRSNESLGFIYFMILTAKSEKGRLEEAFGAGADDYLTKPCDRGELLLRMRAASRIAQLESDTAKRERVICKTNAEMAILNDKLRRLAVSDELTGLGNRRLAMQKLDELWNVADRYELALSIISLDIDRFKSVNDTYGHDAGDVVLKAIADEISKAVRNTDVVARVGGEEFLVIAPGTGIEGASGFAERIRERVESSRIETGSGTLRVTVSLGLASKTDAVSGTEALLKYADLALYTSKDAGRNRWTVADEELIASANCAPATGGTVAAT